MVVGIFQAISGGVPSCFYCLVAICGLNVNVILRTGRPSVYIDIRCVCRPAA